MSAITKVSAAGPTGLSGIAKAFHMHSRALATFADVDVLDLGQLQNFEADFLYFHGAPKAAERIGFTGRSIAFLMCESSELSDAYHQNHVKFDEIWTASTYCQEVLERELDRKVKVVPHCALHYRLFEPRNEIPIVLVAFDGNSRLARKNPVGSIKAVKAAFGRDCKLLIKAKNLSGSYKQWIQQQVAGMDYQMITESVNDAALVQLYKKADILISLHRSEGFGLHLLEAMAAGVKVVATDWGGNTDFLTQETGFPVEAVEVPVSDTFFKGTWGEPDFDSAVAQLRAAKEDTRMAATAFEKALEFSFINTIKKTQEAL